MKISFIKEPTVPLRSLGVGDFFLLSNTNAVYMHTDTPSEEAKFKRGAIAFPEGYRVMIDVDKPVIPVNAELIITPKQQDSQ